MNCEATLSISDDYGDNEATMHCQLEVGHEGRHRETFFEGRATVEWDDETDEGAQPEKEKP